MLPKPKELTGKAIPFMEWCAKKLKETERVEFSCEYNVYGEKLADTAETEILNFFSQPFTPEMLQEYFEGFEYSEHFGRICYKFHNLLYLKEYTIGEKKCFDLRIDTFERVNKDYLTLNLFILLCLNRDITLTWKEKQ